MLKRAIRISLSLLVLFIGLSCHLYAQSPSGAAQLERPPAVEQKAADPATVTSTTSPPPPALATPSVPVTASPDLQQPTTSQSVPSSSSAQPSSAQQPVTPLKQSLDLPVSSTATPATASVTISWQPPAARARGKGPFVPAPKEGNNIFKGEARQWLADAIEKIGGDNGPLLENAAISSYLTQLGQYLAIYSRAPATNYRFIVTESEAPGANSIGDGRIYISLGLLRIVESEDELAGAIAHEMAHDAYSHVARTLTRQLYWLAGVSKVNSRSEVDSALEKLSGVYERNKLAVVAEKISGISRLDELKADHEAFYTAYRAGYNPRALILLLKRIEQQANAESPDTALVKFKRLIFGSHPLTSHRAFSLDWEAGFIKLPTLDIHYESAGFTTMKAEIARHAALVESKDE